MLEEIYSAPIGTRAGLDTLGCALLNGTSTDWSHTGIPRLKSFGILGPFQEARPLLSHRTGGREWIGWESSTETPLLSVVGPGPTADSPGEALALNFTTLGGPIFWRPIIGLMLHVACWGIPQQQLRRFTPNTMSKKPAR